MKERPIIFSGEMVRAILVGRKTQTRRIVKNNLGVCDECFQLKSVPHNYKELHNKDGSLNEAAVYFGEFPYLKVVYCDHNEMCGSRIRCPYGQPGDRLWVREAFRIISFAETETYHVEYKADNSLGPIGSMVEWVDEDKKKLEQAQRYCKGLQYSPSIFMPRWASRIALEIINVRVERVQDIGEEDAEKEGIFEWEKEHGDYQNPEDSYIGVFSLLWDSINKKRGYGWKVNPFVWVVEFKVVEKK